ncbi:hypothetical protein RCH16_002058 [Cryobacterium sp. MP_M5]|uniref:hypothetical protein n=1 Tax=unclassified Cryobacterium TaxID=2649013 RepID=UPI0018C9BCE8|nr:MULTISPECIES: hypothetical protein [unclassified Cryobacterium]MBG6058943.1 hypothetical protein [Cryobacterium sp. MP_M3]MEC5177048.1 hypothetical protein [Cryobacterium sp. MP_M5]
MDSILTFVALRPPVQGAPPAPRLADGTAFQQELAHAVDGPTAAADAVAAARAFADGVRFVVRADQVNRGPELVSLVEKLTGDDARTLAQVTSAVRAAIGGIPAADWAEDAGKAKDSVLAGYLLEPDGPSAALAVTLVRAYALAEAVSAGVASVAGIDSLLAAPLLLPDTLIRLRDTAPVAAETPSPEAAVTELLHRFAAARDEHARLGQALTDLDSHDEDELLLSELGEQRPLADLYRTRSARAAAPRENDHNRPKPTPDEDAFGSSPLRRAASRSNVVLSDTAVRLLSTPAQEALRSLELDPATSAVRDMQLAVRARHDAAGQDLRTLSIQLGTHLGTVDDRTHHLISELIGKWKVDPVDDPAATEPVATAAPGAHTAVTPLGIADLHVVRTHLSRYERGEVASLENALPGEKLTHTVSQIDETETTNTTETEQTDLRSLAQTAAEQSSGKTTAQAVGSGRGPLTSDGPETFSRTVTDAVSSSSTNRTRNTAVQRMLRRNEQAQEHLIDNAAGAGPRLGVYQWLDKIYQAQVFSYGTRLLYDVIVPEPAALFREALARPRGEGVLPSKPARFTVPADTLGPENWSYYATGHHASGVEAPPQAQIIVTENFGGKAADPFSGELNANNLELGESRSTRVPKGFKATTYRLVALASGWTAFRLRVVIGSKRVAIDGDWSGKVFTGRLDGEVESLPVGLIADGDGVSPGLCTLAVAIEIICEPTEAAIAAWQTKAHGLILAANQQRFADYEERVANRDATARLTLRDLTPEAKNRLIRTELQRTVLAVLTGQNFSTFNALRFDGLGFPYPDATATLALSAYIRFFEQAVEWDHLECAFFPYFWGSRSSWVSKLLTREADPRFTAFLGAGAARVVLPIRPGYEIAFERFLNTGTTLSTTELLDVGGPLWVSLIAELRAQGAAPDSEKPVGAPWEFRLASDLVRARRDDRLPTWTLTAGDWVEKPDAGS